MAPESDNSITRLLARAHAGDRAAGDEVFRQIYAELHRVARTLLRSRKAGDTLQATALVNEAYIRMCGGEWIDRQHYLAVAARAMRSLIIDHARAKRSRKRTPPGERRLLEELADAHEARSLDLVALDQALEKLRSFDERAVKLVELRTFAGLPMAEVAAALDMPLRTVEREWQTVRVWLVRELT